MGDAMLTAAGSWKELLLPTDFVVSQRRYRSASLALTAAGGAGRTIRSCRSGGNGRIWYGRRGVEVEVWQREGEGDPREAGARE
jgi:hypothetical protein